MTRWWLSFADPDRPTGEQFLGACIVEAADEIAALKVAHALRINPGGEVRFQDIDEEKAAQLSFDLSTFYDRFLPPDEALDLAERVSREMAS